MTDELVLRDDTDSGVTTLTLNRPEKLNALTPDLFVELPQPTIAKVRGHCFTARRISGLDAAAMGLVNQAVADDGLDGAVAALAAEIVANSWDTNRIDKAVLADTVTMDRGEALAYERSLPYGRPRDMAERMARGR